MATIYPRYVNSPEEFNQAVNEGDNTIDWCRCQCLDAGEDTPEGINNALPCHAPIPCEHACQEVNNAADGSYNCIYDRANAGTE